MLLTPALAQLATCLAVAMPAVVPHVAAGVVDSAAAWELEVMALDCSDESAPLAAIAAAAQCAEDADVDPWEAADSPADWVVLAASAAVLPVVALVAAALEAAWEEGVMVVSGVAHC